MPAPIVVSPFIEQDRVRCPGLFVHGRRPDRTPVQCERKSLSCANAQQMLNGGIASGPGERSQRDGTAPPSRTRVHTKSREEDGLP